MGMEPTTAIAGEPALSFTYDPKRSLYEQFCKAQGGYEGEGELEAAVRRAEEITGDGEDEKSDAASSAEEAVKKPTILNNPNAPFANMFSLFEGSPTYKQRRKKTTKKGSADSTGRSTSVDDVSDHYSRDTTRMSAADMFMAQARGELASPGMIESTRSSRLRISELCSRRLCRSTRCYTC
jgi:transcription factor STE12